MLNRNLIGHALSPHTVEVEKGRLRFFAKSIGQDDPIYFDEDAAQKAGYASLPVPPTFFFCLQFDAPDPSEIFKVLEINIGKILHGEQSFTYHKTACAGDQLTYQSKIADIQTKKAGALEVVFQDTEITDQTGDLIAEMRSLIMVRH